MRVWLCVVVVLLHVVISESTDWYVSNGAVGGDGTHHAPFGDLKAAFAVAESGDSIYVTPGIYPAKNNTGLILTPELREIELFCYNCGPTIVTIDLSESNGASFLSANHTETGKYSITIMEFKFFGQTSGNIFEVAETGSLALVKCQFFDNEVEEGHCILATGDATITIAESSFLQNGWNTNGPALHLQPSPETKLGPIATITNVFFTENAAFQFYQPSPSPSPTPAPSPSPSPSPVRERREEEEGGDGDEEVVTLGGAVYAGGGATLASVDSTFSGNLATQGGAVWSEESDIVTLTRSTFESNSAVKAGAFGSSGTKTFQADGCTFNENVSTKRLSGANLFFSHAISASISNSSFKSDATRWASERNFLRAENSSVALSSLYFSPPVDDCVGYVCVATLSFSSTNVTSSGFHIPQSEFEEFSTLKSLDSPTYFDKRMRLVNSSIELGPGDLFAGAEMTWQGTGSLSRTDGLPFQVSVEKLYFYTGSVSFVGVEAVKGEFFYQNDAAYLDFGLGNLTFNRAYLSNTELITPKITTESELHLGGDLNADVELKDHSLMTVFAHAHSRRNPLSINGTVKIGKKAGLICSYGGFTEEGKIVRILDWDSYEGEFSEFGYEYADDDEDDCDDCWWEGIEMFPLHASLLYSPTYLEMKFSQNRFLLTLDIIFYTIVALVVVGVVICLGFCIRNTIRKRKNTVEEREAHNGFDLINEDFDEGEDV